MIFTNPKIHTGMYRHLTYLLSVVLVGVYTPVAGKQRMRFIELASVSDTGLSIADAKKYRNYVYKKLYRWNGLQNYLNPPFTEWHIGDRTTHRNYILSGDINPHFFLFNDLKGSFAIDFTPRYTVRILRNKSYSPRDHQLASWDRSLPVRTPSYLPGGTFYFADPWLNRSTLEQFSQLEYRDDRFLPYRYYSLSLFHHSNGQDGRNDDPTRPPNRVFNIYNGNFSVNLIAEAGITWGYWKKGGRTLIAELRSGAANKHTWDRVPSWYVGIEHVVIPGEPGLKCNCYSLAKLHLRRQWIDVTHYNNLNTLSLIPDSQYEKQRFIVDVSLGSNKYIGAGPRSWHLWPNIEFRYHAGSYEIFRSSTTSAFIAAGYRSQDIYNVYLEDSYPFVQVGLVMGFKVHNDMREILMDAFTKPTPQTKQTQK